MISTVIYLIAYAVALLAATKIVPGIKVDSFASALWFAVVFSVLNTLLFWFFAILSIPFVVLTFGLGIFVVSFIIHGIIFWLADKFVAGVHVNGFGSALLGALCTSAVTWLLYLVLPARR